MFQIFPQDADITPGKRVKFGIDPTFPRLHLGHFVPLRLVRKMKEQGHDVTIVLGTFTAQMGDPSGRDAARPILTAEEVEANAMKIKAMVHKLLGPVSIFLNGEMSFTKMAVPDLMLIASKFTVQQVLNRDSFQKRLQNNQPLGLHETLVPLLQGWDSVALKTEIEIGGQDQLFNFKIARQLQEEFGQKPQACILMPIIRGTDGQKMSKSLDNCIFLDENPRDMFGQVMSIPDDVMDEWRPLLSDAPHLPLHPKEQKMRLAIDIVQQLHGEEAAGDALDFFERTVVNKELPDDIPNIQADNIVDAVVAIHKGSKSQARQLIRAGGVQVDGKKIDDEKLSVQPGQLIRAGKRLFGRVQ